MNKKAFFFCFTAVCIAALITGGCKNSTSGDASIAGVTVTPATANVAVGATITLTATVEPANAANKKINWSSSNDAIAAVSNGVVTGIAPGQVTITAASAANPAKRASCAVTVTSGPITYTWTFGTIPDGWIPTYQGGENNDNTVDVDYGNGMTLIGSSVPIRIRPAQESFGFTGCIQPQPESGSSGLRKFLAIADVPGSFTLTVTYSATGQSNPTTSAIQAWVGDATKVGDPGVLTNADAPRVLTWDYTGAGGDLELWITNGGLRIYEVTITTGGGGGGGGGGQLEIPHTWEFRTPPAGWVANLRVNTTNVDYGYGMTLTGALQGSRFFPAQTRPDGLIGCLQPDGSDGPFLTIEGVPAAFNLTVKYTATNTSANSYVQAVVEPLGGYPGPECNANTDLLTVFTRNYTGASGRLELWAWGGALRVYEVTISEPTPNPANVEFTAPAGIAGSNGNYTYSHSIFGGNTTLNLSAKALPPAAMQDIIWEITGNGAGFVIGVDPDDDTDLIGTEVSTSEKTGNTVTVKFTSADPVTVTATAKETTTKATLTINLTSAHIPVTSITMSVAGDATSVMAGRKPIPLGGGDYLLFPFRTLQFNAAFTPSNASDPITWWVSNNSTNSNEKTATGGSIGDDGLLTVDSNVTSDTDIWVFAVADNNGNPVTEVKKITVTPYATLIWQYEKSAANTLANSGIDVAQTFVGKTAIKGGGRYLADVRGIQMQSQTRWTLGVPSNAHFSGGGSTTNIASYLTNGELDLRDKFKVTVSFAEPGTLLDNDISNGTDVVSLGGADFTVQVQNNTVGSGASVFGTAANQVKKTPESVGDLVFEFDPANFTFTPQALAAGINDKETVLSRAFIYFRSTSYTVITGIKIEYID